jgi:hypothetical protein
MNNRKAKALRSQAEMDSSVMVAYSEGSPPTFLWIGPKMDADGNTLVGVVPAFSQGATMTQVSQGVPTRLSKDCARYKYKQLKKDYKSAMGASV